MLSMANTNANLQTESAQVACRPTLQYHDNYVCTPVYGGVADGKDGGCSWRAAGRLAGGSVHSRGPHSCFTQEDVLVRGETRSGECEGGRLELLRHWHVSTSIVSCTPTAVTTTPGRSLGDLAALGSVWR